MGFLVLGFPKPKTPKTLNQIKVCFVCVDNLNLKVRNYEFTIIIHLKKLLVETSINTNTKRDLANGIIQTAESETQIANLMISLADVLE